ncbi:MAG: YciI family protein [Calditrichota bacterium]
MEHESERKKPSMLNRRRPLGARRPINHDAAHAPTARPRDILYFQIHYQPRPGARKLHLSAVQHKLTERLQDMVRRGQLLLSGGYPTSIGGMWLLRVRSRAEAERLVLDNPAVSCNLVTYRIVELQEPMGVLVQQEREHLMAVEAAEKAPAAE